jgi:hypothetical protein
MDSNFNTAVCAADLRRMQISLTTPQKPKHFCICRIPRHAAPFCTTPHDATLVPRDAAFVPQLLWQIPH